MVTGEGRSKEVIPFRVGALVWGPFQDFWNAARACKDTQVDMHLTQDGWFSKRGWVEIEGPDDVIRIVMGDLALMEQIMKGDEE